MQSFDIISREISKTNMSKSEHTKLTLSGWLDTMVLNNVWCCCFRMLANPVNLLVKQLAGAENTIEMLSPYLVVAVKLV